jgi:hypothetical protein
VPAQLNSLADRPAPPQRSAHLDMEPHPRCLTHRECREGCAPRAFCQSFCYEQAIDRKHILGGSECWRNGATFGRSAVRTGELDRDTLCSLIKEEVHGREHGVRPSMGSVGDCYDNAMCESRGRKLAASLMLRRRFPRLLTLSYHRSRPDTVPRRRPSNNLCTKPGPPQCGQCPRPEAKRRDGCRQEVDYNDCRSATVVTPSS